MARLAQAVEHFIGNEEVPGSTPGVSTRIDSVTWGSAKLVAGQVEGSDSDESEPEAPTRQARIRHLFIDGSSFATYWVNFGPIRKRKDRKIRATLRQEISLASSNRFKPH